MKTNKKKILFKHEGVVTNIGDYTFTANLVDMIGNDNDKITTICTGFIPESDMDRLFIGNTFIFTILELSTGQIQYNISFRRIERWPESEIKLNRKKALEMRSTLQIDMPGKC